MNEKMSGRENTRKLFLADKPERAGLHDNPWARTLTQWVAEGYPTKKAKRKSKEKVCVDGAEVERETEKEVDVPVTPVEHFGFDMVGVGGWYDMMPLRVKDVVVEETKEWKVVRNGGGALLKWWKDKDGTPEHVAFHMTSREIWDREYRPHLLGVEKDRVNVKAAKDALDYWQPKDRWTHYGTLFIWEHMRRTLGDLCLYESLVTDPEWIRDIGRVYTDHLKAHYKILLEEAGVPDGMWIYEDLGYKQRLFCSPEHLKELIFPFYKEVVDFFHSYKMKVVLHSCGYTMNALPLIVEAGFDGLNPLEVAAENDIFKAAEQYGDKLVFVGGFDKRILETHDKALIRREVTRFMKGMKERGARFLFGSDHSLSTNTRYDDFKCAVDTYRELCAY